MKAKIVAPENIDNSWASLDAYGRSLDRATQRKEQLPIKVAENVYKFPSTSGKTYTIFIEETPFGVGYVCNCAAAQFGLTCLHGGAIASLPSENARRMVAFAQLMGDTVLMRPEEVLIPQIGEQYRQK